MVAFVEFQEIIGLQKLVIEFQEGKPCFQADFVSLEGKHAVDGKMAPDVPEKIDVIQISKPFRIIDQFGVSTEIQETLHLRFDLPDIILQLLFCEHLPHFCFAAGIPDHCSSSTHQGDHPLPVSLQVGQSHQRDEVSDME